MADKIPIIITLEESQALAALTRLTKKTQETGTKGAKAFKGMNTALSVFSGTLAAIGASRALAVISAEARLAADGFIEFSKAVAEINSILPANEKLTLASKQAFIEFSSSFAGDPQTQAKAFYSIVSAGVQGTAKQLKTLAIANKAAVAGLVNIDTAAFALVSSVNAYSRAGLTAQQASDALFVAVREGQTTFGELASSIGTVAPLAAAVGVEFSELVGVLAFITKSGVSTDEAVTGIRATLTAIIKPTDGAVQALKQFNKETGNTLELSTQGIKDVGGFGNFLLKLGEVTGGSTEKLGKLVPNIRALSSVINVAQGDTADFNRILNETATAAGATEIAFKVIADSAGFQFERFVQELRNIPQAFLVNFEQPIAEGIKAIRAFVSGDGLLSVVDAVDLAISAFVTFSGALRSTANFFDFVADSALAAAQSIKEFSLFQTEATKQQIENIKRARADILKDTATRLAAQDKLIASTDKFRKKISEARVQQVNDNKKANDQIASDDAAAAKAKFDAANQQFDIIRELRASQAELDVEESELVKLEQELQDDENFQRISDNLGREATLRAFFRAKELEESGKLAAAKKLITATEEKSRKVSAESSKTFENSTNKERAANLKSTLGTISGLMSSSSEELFRIGQAAALANATISGHEAVVKALASAAPPLNFILAALVGVATGARIASIASQSPPKFQEGGIVPGSSLTGDRVTAQVNSREMLLNQRQQRNLFNAVDSGNLGGGGGTSIVIEGDFIGTEENIDRMIDGINNAVEFRNAQLRTA